MERETTWNEPASAKRETAYCRALAFHLSGPVFGSCNTTSASCRKAWACLSWAQRGFLATSVRTVRRRRTAGRPRQSPRGSDWAREGIGTQGTIVAKWSSGFGKWRNPTADFELGTSDPEDQFPNELLGKRGNGLRLALGVSEIPTPPSACGRKLPKQIDFTPCRWSLTGNWRTESLRVADHKPFGIVTLHSERPGPPSLRGVGCVWLAR
jgi:hypothetical protein